MNKKDKSSEEQPALESRISIMKQQFQKSYDIFIKAHDELLKISFDNLTLPENKDFKINEKFTNLDTEDVKDILASKSVDDSIQKLQSKVNHDDENFINTFPDITKLIKIMNSLQGDIKSLKEQQDSFTKLANDVKDEMNRFEKEIEGTSSQLNDLNVESVDDSSYDEREEDEDSDCTLSD